MKWICGASWHEPESRRSGRLRPRNRIGQNTALTLIGNTAQYYWQIANLNQQIKQQQAGLEIGQQTLAMVQSRYDAGAAGQLDLQQAQQSLINRENTYRTLQQQREENRNALAILFNRSPTDRQAERRSLDITQESAGSERFAGRSHCSSA
ncbi:efflux transporter, outer membrane factor (OMF) lipoprotein, NodT family [Serratia fonticola]|uniref:Efflux transporter, outer membrane factor (OMF) lipoprotein, NodT family n=1 Tax=Serratia fonticola TaxID=47917 RepID=A0A4U9VC80_SERFO|nr:efflux transporter, outer membrane factor (OMF) lipoprotein, NodT family [Serratia fonticola]